MCFYAKSQYKKEVPRMDGSLNELDDDDLDMLLDDLQDVLNEEDIEDSDVDMK